MTQSDLAMEAEVSCNQLSSLEAGRLRPSRRIALALAACLDIPLRDRNQMLAAAGYDPEFQERNFTEAAFAVVRENVEAILTAFGPNPALAIDRHWTMLAANRAIDCLVSGAEPALLRPPVNLLRLCLHPAGIAPRIVNLDTWRAHIVRRVRRQIAVTGDPVLIELLDEVRDYPSAGGDAAIPDEPEVETLAVPLRLATLGGVLSFFGTTTTFCAASDITMAEVRIESFLPGDARTREALSRHAKVDLVPVMQA